MRDTTPDRVRLGVFEVDLRAGELRDGERAVCLQDQPLFILRMLVERSGEMVSREEIQKKLWPNDTVVDFDHGINAAIRKLRLAFGDSADEPKYLATVARRGYRLLVAVEWADGAADDDSPHRDDAIYDVDAPSQRPTGSHDLIGRKVSHYRVLEVLGGGGMGMLYKAEDLKLGRQVALKFLPEELAWDTMALRRFEREARAASSLDHPNICTIYEVEEHDGQPFLVMQLLHGVTLRDRLAALIAAHNKLTLGELLDIAMQICDGLQAAHDKGIIHRDIKPANIFLTSTGQVKILDFGLAKLVSGAQQIESDGLQLQPDGTATAPQPARLVSLDATLTRLGVAIGTAGYMSPEQIRGEKLDARSDLFSFGLVLYEMATGQRAFGGDTAAILQDAILNNSPVPVRDLNSALPPKLAGTIDKALAKDRAERYQSATEIRTDLEEVNGAKKSLSLTGWKWPAVALLLLAVAALVGALYWRSRSAIKLTDTDTIVLADFVNQTSDPVFNDALNTALRVELEQTPFLNLLGSDKVQGTLKQMNHAENEKLTTALARDVCLHTHSKAVVQGTISDAGNRYAVELMAENCQTGKTLAETKLEVNDRSQIVKTLGIAGNQLRQDLGEPKTTLQRFNQPLDTATSSSPEALQSFAQGWSLFIKEGPSAGIPFYKRAVEADPTFADAYCYLGVAYGDMEESGLATQNVKRAYEFRDRVTRRQRYLIESLYHTEATGDIEKAVRILTEMADSYPRYWVAHNNLSADLVTLGQYEQGAAQAQEALRLEPNSSNAMDLLMTANIGLNRLDGAKAIFEAAQSHNADTENLRITRYRLAFVEGDKAAMAEQLKWAVSKAGDDGQLLDLQAATEVYSGRLGRAREFSQRAVESATRAGVPETAALSRAEEALREAMIGEANRARKKSEEGLRLSHGKDVTPHFGLVLALAGDVAQAQSIADSLNQEHPLDTMIQKFWLPSIYGALNLQKDNPEKALEALYGATIPYAAYDGTECLNSIYLRGLAYLQSGQGQQAASEFQKITGHPELAINCLVGALSRLQLGRAQAMMGDNAAARKSYQDFLTLWKEADPDIPIYKQAKAEYAKLQ